MCDVLAHQFFIHEICDISLHIFLLDCLPGQFYRTPDIMNFTFWMLDIFHFCKYSWDLFSDKGKSLCNYLIIWMLHFSFVIWDWATFSVKLILSHHWSKSFRGFPLFQELRQFPFSQWEQELLPVLYELQRCFSSDCFMSFFPQSGVVSSHNMWWSVLR